MRSLSIRSVTENCRIEVPDCRDAAPSSLSRARRHAASKRATTALGDDDRRAVQVDETGRGETGQDERCAADVGISDARELKTFDLTSKFGPCCGLTRIERWDRARALGLDPPKRVLEILHRRGEASARWRECVWHGRV